MNNPKLSIVTVCYNAVDLIEKTIQSIINQTYKNVEYIVIDGASTDGTVKLVEKYLDEIDCFVTESDDGIYDAMNKGIKVAKGEWINFMNAGDVFYNNRVLELVASEINPDCGVIFGDMAILKNDVLYREKARPFYNNPKLHHYMGFNHQCTFVRLDLAKNNCFNLKYKLAADYNMIIELFRKGVEFQQLDIVIAKYLDSGISVKKRREHLFETLMIDHPDDLLLNYIYSYIIDIHKRIKSSIVYVLNAFSPSLVKTLRKEKGFLLELSD